MEERGRELSKTPRPEFDPGVRFVERSRRYLVRDYPARIGKAVSLLSEDDVWWRPNPASNSVGNLLLHLAGNVRQWIVSGVGGASDHRRREEEFSRRGGMTAREVVASLEAAVAEADEVLAGLDPVRLGETLRIQGNEVTVLEAVYHVVEHFSMHAGQILYVAKLRTGEDLQLWTVGEDGSAIPRW